MALEKILTDLTAALDKHTEAMNNFLAAGGKAATTSGTTKAAEKKTETKTETKAASKVDTAAVAEQVKDYMKAGEPADREEAMKNIGKIVKHFEAERFTTIPEDKMQEALDMLNDFKEGRTPEAFASEDDGGGDLI